MIHSFDLFKRFLKNIESFSTSKKNTYYYLKMVFRHLETKW